MPDGIQRVFKTALNDTGSTSALEVLGTIRREGGQTFKYVKFSGTLVTAAGDPVCYVISDTTFQTVDGTNSVNGAGIAMAAHAVAVVEYGWIQVKGLSAPITTLTSGTAGQGVTNTGAANKALKVVAAVTDQLVGWVANAAAKTIQLEYPF